MNYATLRHHLSEMGYEDDEIEDDLSNIAEDLNDRARDYLVEQEYADKE